LSRMRTILLRDPYSVVDSWYIVPKLYRRAVLLLLYNYKVKGVGPKAHVYGGVRIGLRSEGPRTEKVNDRMTAADHVSHLLMACSRQLYALRILRAHGIPRS